MQYFFEVSSALQVLLLLLTQLTIITLTAFFMWMLRRNYPFDRRHSVGLALLLLLNAGLYVLMQLDSRVTAADHSPQYKLPYVLLLFAVLSSLGYAFWAALGNSKNRRALNDTSIKEAFDNLPTGVCFFSESGLPVLCNRAMHRFSFAISGKDVQFVTDLEECFAGDFIPLDGVRREDKVFSFSDGTAWQLEKRSFSYKNGAAYTQYIATDVTNLNENRLELARENDRLSKAQAELQRLSANVVATTREEEILNTKMRVHDEMGRCLMEARKFLQDASGESIPAETLHSWQRAVSMLKYNNDVAQEDMLRQIRTTCRSVRLEFVQTGHLPQQETAAYLLTCAVRECVTNAVRYAGASKLFADFSETEALARVCVSNNGDQPKEEIVEGGGLSTLRRRIEREGGSMLVQSLPEFRLTVTVPKEKEGRL